MSLNDERLRFPPVSRAAYSDRTAWLLAEMSRLAYEQFESPSELLDEITSKLASLQDIKAIRQEIQRFLEKHAEPSGAGVEQLKSQLAIVDFDLVRTFNNGGTQAFLAKRKSDGMAVLAFRGTEKDFKDIKTDLNARFYRADGAKMHSGFRRAYDYVAGSVSGAVSGLGDCRLYITGHSLGGALALIAARSLNADNVAACYTFGSPKVGSSEFGDDIKVPIYRVVNAADLVPRVPPTWIVELVILLGRLLPVPYLRKALIHVLEQFRGYRHHGDMRYLSASNQKDYADLRLISERIGLPEPIDVSQIRTKTGWRKDRRCYRDVLSAADRNLVERICYRELAEFGYSW